MGNKAALKVDMDALFASNLEIDCAYTAIDRTYNASVFRLAFGPGFAHK